MDLAAVPKCYTAKQVFHKYLLGKVSSEAQREALRLVWDSKGVISLVFICLEFPISLLFQV